MWDKVSYNVLLQPKKKKNMLKRLSLKQVGQVCSFVGMGQPIFENNYFQDEWVELFVININLILKFEKGTQF